jgi:hypothetical protein
MTPTAADYAFCVECERLRLRPPPGLFGTNDVACEVCGQGYAVLVKPVTADALAWELHAARKLIAELAKP